MAKPKTLDELLNKYGTSEKPKSFSPKSNNKPISTNNKATTTKSDKGKQSNSSASSLDDLLNKYDKVAKENRKKNTPFASPSKPTTEKKHTDFNTETNNAFKNAYNKANTKTYVSSNLSDDERNKRIKEINSELNTLNTKMTGYSRATSYGTNKYLNEAIKKDSDRIAELKEELKTLEIESPNKKSAGEQFLDSAGYYGEKLGRGVVDGLEGITDFAWSIPLSLGWGVTSGFGLFDNSAEGWFEKKYNEINQNDITDYFGEAEKRYDAAPKWVKDSGWLPETIGNLLPVVAETYLTGGASSYDDLLAAGGSLADDVAKTGASWWDDAVKLGINAVDDVAKTLTNPKKLLTNPDVHFGMSAGGNAIETSIDKGASPLTSTAYGMAEGALEIATEKLFGGYAGLGDDFGKAGATAIKKTASLANPNLLNRIWNSPVTKKALAIASEGIEEQIVTFTDPLLQRAIGVDANAEFATWKDYVESGTHGVILSVVMNALGVPISKHNKSRAISSLNESTEVLNGLIQDDTLKLQPLPNNATEEEIVARQKEVTAVAMAFDNAVKKAVQEEQQTTVEKPIEEQDTLEKVAMDVVASRNATQTNETEPNSRVFETDDSLPTQEETELKTGNKPSLEVAETPSPLEVAQKEAEAKATEAAFEAGRQNVPREKVNLVTPEQEEAYNNGRIEHIKNMPAENAQKEEKAQTSTFETELDNTIKRGSGTQGGKERIIEFYKGNPSVADAVNFLKNEYGHGGWSYTFADGTRGWHDHDSKGIKLTKNGESRESKLFSWNEVDKHIRKLIESGEYSAESKYVSTNTTSNEAEESTPMSRLYDALEKNIPSIAKALDDYQSESDKAHGFVKKANGEYTSSDLERLGTIQNAVYAIAQLYSKGTITIEQAVSALAQAYADDNFSIFYEETNGYVVPSEDLKAHFEDVKNYFENEKKKTPEATKGSSKTSPISPKIEKAKPTSKAKIDVVEGELLTLKHTKNIYSLFKGASKVKVGEDIIIASDVAVRLTDDALAEIKKVVDENNIEMGSPATLDNTVGEFGGDNNIVISGNPKVAETEIGRRKIKAYVFKVGSEYYVCEQKYLDAFNNGENTIKANEDKGKPWTVHDKNNDVIAMFIPAYRATVTDAEYDSFLSVNDVLEANKARKSTQKSAPFNATETRFLCSQPRLMTFSMNGNQFITDAKLIIRVADSEVDYIKKEYKSKSEYNEVATSDTLAEKVKSFISTNEVGEVSQTVPDDITETDRSGKTKTKQRRTACIVDDMAFLFDTRYYDILSKRSSTMKILSGGGIANTVVVGYDTKGDLVGFIFPIRPPERSYIEVDGKQIPYPLNIKKEALKKPTTKEKPAEVSYDTKPSQKKSVGDDGVDKFTVNKNTKLKGGNSYSLKESEYLKLASDPEQNEARLRELLDEEAKKSGFPARVYHGTTAFGFTFDNSVFSKKVDVKKSDDGISFFATDSLDLAQTYSGVLGETSIKKGNGQSVENQQRYNSLVNNFVNKVNEIAGEDLLKADELPFDKYIAKIKKGRMSLDQLSQEMTNYTAEVIESIEGIGAENDRVIWELSTELETALYGMNGKSGNYGLYANTDGFLEIDGKGAKWSSIPFDKIPSKTTANTREIVKWAKDNGYNGVLFKNIYDIGYHGSVQKNPANVYAFFNPRSQLKSADPVTYNAFGKVVPLSKRFANKADDVKNKGKGRLITDNLNDNEDADKLAMWTTTRVGDKVKPKSISEIVATIQHKFGINITTGHIRGKGVLGQYDKNSQGIRTKIANNLPVISHELGHYFERTLGIKEKLSAEIEEELTSNLDERTLKNYPEEKLVREGVAEYVRRFLQNRETAAIDYPLFTDFFLQQFSGKDLAILEQLADDINAYYSLDADTATSSIRLSEDGAIDLRTPMEKLKEKASSLYQAFIDSNHAIKRFDRATGSKAYMLASNAAYSDAIAGQIVTGDLTDINGKYVSSGLKTVLNGLDLNNKQEYLVFGEYLTVKHGPERLREGKRVFADDKKNNTSFMERRQAEIEAQYPQFEEVSERLYSFIRKFYQTWAVDTGLLPKETLEFLNKRWEYYVPFNRVMEKGKGKNGTKRGFANQNNTLNKTKKDGSGRDIQHPVDNLINNIVRMVNAGVRNNVMLNITNAAEKLGADATFLEKVPNPISVTKVDMTGVKDILTNWLEESDMDADSKDKASGIVNNFDDILFQYGRGKAHGNVVTVLKDGNPQAWKINDVELLQSLTSLSPKTMDGILDAYAVLSRFMTANITGNNLVWSIFSNLPRDMATFFTYSKNKNIAKMAKGVGSAYLNKAKSDSADPLYKEFLAMGGGKTSAYTADRNLAKDIRKKISDRKFNPNPLDWIGFVSDTIESGPRFATYKMMREAGMTPQEAFYEAMDITVNFRRSGRISKELNKVVPFFNANMQGLDKFYRWITAENVSGTDRKKAIRNRAISFVAVSAALAAISYAINNGDDEKEEDYEQLSTYIKNSYWVFPVGDGKYFAIPKPREIGVLSSFFETCMEYGIGENDHAFDEFYAYASENFLPAIANDIAQVGTKGLVETGMNIIGSFGMIGVVGYMGANRDFLGRPIVSSSLQNLEPKDQYTDRTSKIAYWLGQAFNGSPEQIDYFFQQILGGWWKGQKALFPVGEKNKDWSLGVGNTYIKDNQYSTDLTNWLYDRADTTAKSKNSNPDDIEKAITAKWDSNMVDFYGTYYKKAKADSNSTSVRSTRQLVLDMIREYQKGIDGDYKTSLQKAVEKVCKTKGSTEYMPSVMSGEVTDGNDNKHSLSDVQYVEYQTDYLRLYWETVEDTLSPNMTTAEKAEILLAAKRVAKEQATERTLKRIGAPSTKFATQYEGVDNEALTEFLAGVSEANEDNKVEKKEVVNVITELDVDNDDAWKLYLSKYDSKSALEAEEYGIDAKLYMSAVVDMSGIKADYKPNGKVINGSRRAKIERYLNSVCSSYKEYLFLLGTEYDSVKDDHDYVQYFGK